MTYDYMNNERGLDHLVWSYSPDAGGNNELDVVERYPGDEIVDMIGIDFYQFSSGEQYVERMKYALDIISAFAQERGKMIAVTEAGYEGVKNPKWWTEVLYPAIKDYPVSYVLLWRNACDDNMQHHFYVPFPGHESVEDFKVFTTLDKMMFL
jgi:mannan endo-1,4-beta-mannosidase